MPDEVRLADDGSDVPTEGLFSRWTGAAEHCVVKLSGDLPHYTNPAIASCVAKINYYDDIYLHRQLAEKRCWAAVPAVLRSPWRFVRACVFQLGVWDGYSGFLIATSTAYATLVRHTRPCVYLKSGPPPARRTSVPVPQ